MGYLRTSITWKEGVGLSVRNGAELGKRQAQVPSKNTFNSACHLNNSKALSCVHFSNEAQIFKLLHLPVCQEGGQRAFSSFQIAYFTVFSPHHISLMLQSRQLTWLSLWFYHDPRVMLAAQWIQVKWVYALCHSIFILSSLTVRNAANHLQINVCHKSTGF